MTRLPPRRSLRSKIMLVVMLATCAALLLSAIALVTFDVHSAGTGHGATTRRHCWRRYVALQAAPERVAAALRLCPTRPTQLTIEALSTMTQPDDGVRVVIVDDMPDVCLTLGMHLELDGYEVRSATSAAEAIELVARFNPHCVLLDVHMPDVDGLELARTLRSQYGDDIVLVAVTGRSPTDTRVAGAFVVVDHYLQKPIDLEQLRKVLPNLTA